MEKPEIRIESLEAVRIIYIRFRGSYVAFRKHSRKMFEQLFEFAEKNNLIVPETTKVITIYNDNPFITQSDQLRTSIAMTIPDYVPVSETDEISLATISGKFAIGRFDLSLKEYTEAWHYMYNDWLFNSNYTPRDSFPFEMYISEPPKNQKSKSITEIYIPIE